ncbi:MAG: type I-C CRISPR-associated protein Cas8c/Csd1, partial [Monoglobales bacterium]
MAWMNMIYQTYENNAKMAGKAVDEKAPLSLVAHMPANAQIEIVIDGSGNFIKASGVDKNFSKTLIPVTEQSAGRSSGDAPHALCDTLSYVAGDFGRYLVDEKAAKKCDIKFSKYISALEAWVNSDYSHPKA